MSAAMGVLTGLGEERVAYVSRDDLAAAAAGALLGEGHAGAIYNGTGPAVVSGEERARTASQVLGKPLGYVVIDEAQLRGGLTQAGLPEIVVDVMADIKKNFVRGDFDVLTTDIERLSGRSPKSLREILAAAVV